MKQRVVSGFIIGLITLTSVLIGGYYFKAVLLFVAVWGSYEFVSSRNHKVNYLEYIIMLLFVLLILFFFNYSLELIILEAIVLITLAVFDSKVNFEEICVDFFESIVLALPLHYMMEIELYSKWFFGYIILASYLTDLFAFVFGLKFGKHKFNERISPKKTIEGAIGGYLSGSLSSFIYACFFNFFNFDVSFVIICSLTMPIMSQIGDLAFSLIKRHYGIKDYSSLIPGHGGLLDRLDSLLFVLLIFGGLTVFIR